MYIHPRQMISVSWNYSTEKGAYFAVSLIYVHGRVGAGRTILVVKTSAASPS